MKLFKTLSIKSKNIKFLSALVLNLLKDFFERSRNILQQVQDERGIKISLEISSKSTLLIITLFTTSYLYAAKSSAAQLAPREIKKPIPSPARQQQPITKIESYSQALNAIRTMPANMVLSNNIFTAKFIDFVKSLNLSEIENEALLQAGINIHAVWTGDRAKDKTLFLTLKDNIASALQDLKLMPQMQPALPTIPTKTPLTQQQPKTPAMPPAQILPTPIKAFSPVNDVIIILDPTKEETIEKHVGALTWCALQTIIEQAAPIIMTSNILEIITQARQNISAQTLQQLQNTNPNQIDQLATQLAQNNNLGKFSSDALIMLSMAHFNTNNFNCYFHKSAPLVLLIPKQYITKNLPNAIGMNVYDQAQACGFNPTVITAIDDLTPNNLAQQLQTQQSSHINEEQLITNLSALFIPQKRNGELISPERDTKWAIYITGHGSPAHQTIGTVREQLAAFKHNQQQGGKKRNVAQKRSTPSNEGLIKTYEKMVEGRANWPSSQLVPESARVAGLKMSAFAQLLKFFDTTIDTAFVHYSTCFAGGYNQSFVNEILSSLDVNFIVSAEGIDETSVMREIRFSHNNQPPYVKLKNDSFTNFFNLIGLFIGNPKQFVKIKGEKKEPIARILQTIVPGMIEGNQPFVRFPGAGVFGALSLGKITQEKKTTHGKITEVKNTKILTQTIVKAHEIENKPINISNDISTLIVNPSRINVPLNLGKNVHCAIVSPTPTTITAGYEAINTFKEINFGGTIQQLFYNFVHLNARSYTQTFVVNNVTDITIKRGTTNTINNLIIQMKGVSGNTNDGSNEPSVQLALLTPQDLPYGKIGVNVQIIFECNGTIYQCTIGIKNFEDPDLEKIMQQVILTAQPAATTDINAVANKFLTSQEVGKLARPITLDSIAQCINSKIDQQEPFLKETEPGQNNKALLDFLKRKQK